MVTGNPRPRGDCLSGAPRTNMSTWRRLRAPVIWALRHFDEDRSPMLSVCSSTHPGSVRTVNEDYATFDSALSFCAVADGMGGHKAGEVASRMAIDAITSFMRESADTNERPWPFVV